MKYLVSALLYLLAAFTYFLLSFYGQGWQLIQPFLLILLLFYFNSKNPWFYYIFALLCGLFMDSFSSVFGLHSLIFLFIIFLLRNLQLSFFTSKNIFTVILLSIFAFIIFYTSFWLANLMLAWNLYSFSWPLLVQITKMSGLSIFILIVLHILYFNFWVKKNEEQPF